MNTLDVPYVLDNQEMISHAMKENFLNIGRSRYIRMLNLANNSILQRTPALLLAKNTEMELYAIRETKLKEQNITYEEITNLEPIGNFTALEDFMWLSEFTDSASLDTFLRYLKSNNNVPESAELKISGHLELRNLLREEIRRLIKTGQRTKVITIKELKRMILAYCLHEAKNADVLEALKREKDPKTGNTLHTTAIAELILSRLPLFIDGLVSIDPRIIRRRLFEKIASTKVSHRIRMTLFSYFKPDIKRFELIPVLDKLLSMMKKMPLEKSTLKRLRDYINSLKRDITCARTFYEDTFLTTKELKLMRRVHVPRKVMKTKITYMESILREYTKRKLFHLFPTKDWLDLYKGAMSGDCTDSGTLGEKQLFVPEFFNIRIFKGKNWIANIYMLDYTNENGCLLVDRIQYKRTLDDSFVRFFPKLCEAFQTMFNGVNYDLIVMPQKISNHRSIQILFNKYKVHLKKKKISFSKTHKDCFESLQEDQSYYVFAEGKKL